MSAGKEHTIQQTKQSIGYTDRNNSTSQFYHEKGQETTENESTPGTFKRRIGNTVYRVNVHYSNTSKETINDKITRLVKNDVTWDPREVPQELCGERRSDGVSEPLRLRGGERYEVRDDEKAAI